MKFFHLSRAFQFKFCQQQDSTVTFVLGFAVSKLKMSFPFAGAKSFPKHSSAEAKGMSRSRSERENHLKQFSHQELKFRRKVMSF